MTIFLTLVLIVAGVVLFFETPVGKKIGNYLPTPFWIYFIPIVLGSAHILKGDSPTYDLVGLHALPAALVLMLIGTPVQELLGMGAKAMTGMILASVTMIFSVLFSFIFFVRFMPPESFKVAGALLATWVGGSANMLAVKEIILLPESLLAPLIIVDTVLSYAWMALLMVGAGYQKKFLADDGGLEMPATVSSHSSEEKTTRPQKIYRGLVVLAVGLLVGELTLIAGKYLSAQFTFLNMKSWALILASVVSVLLALTPLRRLEKWKASRIGSYLLYLVLATLGVKTTLGAAVDAPIFLIFGVVVLVIHGILLLLTGRYLKIPLFLLSTASQANVGGPVSAPIVASVYRPGTAHVGVLMGLLGALVGTYVGLFGAFACHAIESWVK